MVDSLLDRYYQANPPANNDIGSLEDDLRADRDREIAFQLAQGGDPDRTAKANAIARERGIPAPIVDGNLSAYEAQARAQKNSALIKEYPAIGRWSANPRNVIVAQDDYDNLGLIGKTLYGVKNIGSTLKAGLLTGTSGLWGAITSVAENMDALTPSAPIPGIRSLPQIVGDFTRERQAEGQAMAEAARPQVDNWLAKNLLTGVESLPATATAIGAGLVGGPGTAAAVMGSTVGGNEYARARAAGLSPQRAAVFGASQGAVEFITEKIPASRLIGDIAKNSPFAKTFMRQLVAEIPGEQAATFLQDLNEWATLNPEKTLGEFLSERPEAAASTLVATAGGVGAVTLTARAAQRTTQAAAKVIERVSAASQGAEEAKVIDQIGEAAAASKLKDRDREAYGSLVKMIGEDTGVESLIIPAESLNTYMQMDGYDGGLDAWIPDIEEGLATGGDVIIPIEQALTGLAGTPAWEALKGDMRLSPGGMSRNEAATFDEAMADVMADLSDQMARQDESIRGLATSQDKLRQTITDKLMNAGFTPTIASQQAELLTTRYTTRAERLGRELTGDEFAVDVRQVLPEKLAAVRKADQLDMTVAIMKRRLDPKAKRGRSLLEFIAARGGIEDRGGDLKAMGADQWHKGKPGQRKLVRERTDLQGSLIGKIGNENTADYLAGAAQDAGFFPPGERPDVNALLDAIAEELAGRPTYAEPEAEAGMREAADELRGILENRGVDPEKATNQQIREAVEGYVAEQAEGLGYDQGSSDRAWVNNVDRVIRGERPGAEIRVGETPDILRKVGLNAADIIMASGKLARVRREHPEVSLDVLRALPQLLRKPEAAFPSGKGDGSIIVAVPAQDADGNPVVVPMLAEETGRNVVLSVYGKSQGVDWITKQIDRAKAEGLPVYVREGFADALPKPEPASQKEASSSSSAPIAAEGPAKPERKILSLRPKDKAQYEQSYADGPRGRITFPAAGFGQGPSVIDLFKAQNLSTFLHETGHLWLEELRFDANDPDAPQQLKDDWAKVEAWFAANGHPVENGIIPVEAHELWARGVERYLMEGKAPTTALRKAFETFKGWLVSIYKTVGRLNAPITDEIRGVMDRLIATDQAIIEAAETQNIEALFDSAAQAGMSESEYAAYVETTKTARSSAQDALLAKVMASVKARVTAEYREQREAVRAEIEASVNAWPEFKALRLLKTMPIDTQWVRETYGDDGPFLLPKQVPPVHKDNGANADEVAEMAGFRTGDEMVRALMGVAVRKGELLANEDKRSVRAAMIDQETDAIMNERYGDPLTDGSIEEEALALIHNDQQGEVMAAELRVLGRSTGKRATPYSIAKQWAANKVRSGQVRDMTSRSAIQRYERAASRSGKLALEAIIANDKDAAFRHKQAQMLNNALVAEAKKAADEIDKAVARLEKIATKKTIKSVDQDYLEQAQALLENVELRQRSQVSIDKQGKFEEWAAARTAEGHDIAVPPSFEASIGKTNWTRLTVENLLGLDDAVKQIIHLGRLKQTLIDNKEKREFEAVVGETLYGMGGMDRKPPSDMMEPGRWDSIKSRVASMDAALLKMETVFDWLDQGDSNGVFNRIVFKPISEAQDAEKALVADYINRLTGLLQDIPRPVLKRWNDRVTAPELLNRETGNPFVFTRDQLVSMALNMGNAGNAAKLSGGYGWNEASIMAVLNRELSVEEWRYVQKVWDTIDSLWPQIEAMERDLNGVAPEKVEARTLDTSAGSLRGGYYPVVYDPRRSLEAEQQASKASDLFENIYTRATTPKGFTKERTKVERPVHLSLGVINRHVAEVIHDITHRRAIMQADKFLADRRIAKAVDETLGPEIRAQFRPWLQHIANEWAIDRAGNAGWEKFMKNMRTNTTIVGMGFRVTTMLMQMAGYSNSFERVGAKWVSQAIAQTVKNPISSFNFVVERSGEVRNRMDTLDRDIRDNVKRTLGKVDPLSQVRKFAFHGIGYMDRMVVIPTWLGAYNRATAEGMSERDAIYAADKAVRQSQGAGAAKDLASIQRGTGKAGELMKFLTMFYSYMSAVYQRQRTLGRDIAGAKSASQLPAILARAWWLMIVPPLLSELLSGRGPEDDEDWSLWTFEKILMQALGPIPVVRDVAKPLFDKATGQKGFGYSFTPAQRAAETIVNTTGDIAKLADGEETKRATRNAMESVGYATGLIPGQIATATQFIVDVSYGDQDPETVSDWIEGLAKGKVSED